LLSWQQAEQVPWGVLLLFGGGLSLADAMTRTGLDTWFAALGTHLHGVPPILAIFVVCLACQVLSEVMSNTALTALALPIVAAVAEKSGLPVVPMLAATALGASFAFVLPAGTPPNALIFASRQVRIGQMVRAGLILDVVFALFVTVAVWAAMRAGWGS
jgi:sodium-dependent dicarboxylate transporter 2/3/5